MNCYRIIVGLLLGCLIACDGQETAEQETVQQEEGPVADRIFHQQRRLSAGDSLHIRLLSWGAERSGAYLLLLADSAGQQYVGNSFFREGIIEKAWVDDLDGDHLPEVGLVVQEQGESRYGKLRLHELSEGYTFSTIVQPQLSETLGADYGGRDTLYLNEGNIVREYSLLDRTDSASIRPARRRVVYQLENNRLVVDESKNLE